MSEDIPEHLKDDVLRPIDDFSKEEWRNCARFHEYWGSKKANELYELKKKYKKAIDALKDIYDDMNEFNENEDKFSPCYSVHIIEETLKELGELDETD